MAGHMGNATISVRNLQVIETNPADGTLAVTGAIPGYRGARVQLEVLGAAKHPFTPLQKDQLPESPKETPPPPVLTEESQAQKAQAATQASVDEPKEGQA